LVRLFEYAAAQLGAHIERVGWGWLASGAGDADPYAAAPPQRDPSKTYTYGRAQTIRLASSVAFVVLAAVWLFLWKTVEPDTFGSPITYFIVVFFVVNLALFFLVSVADPRPSRLVSYIRCDPTGIELKHTLRATPRRLWWPDIWGLDVDQGGSLCVVRSTAGALSIPLGSTFGLRSLQLRKKETLIRTIVERASLHLVEVVPMRSATYRRFDAEPGGTAL
jgi:hypothetical protein